MVYQWKKGSKLSVSAQEVGEYLEQIRDRNGTITPEAVLDNAKGSVLEPLFEWRDKKAAVSYRLTQARYILRSLEVTVTQAEPVEVRAYTVVTTQESDEAESRVYATIEEAMRRPEWRAEVLERAKRELRTWRERYKLLSELAAVFAAVDKVG